MNKWIAEMIGYSFESVVRHDRKMKSICKTLHKQTRWNRQMTFLIMTMGACIMMTEKRLQEQRAKIELMEEEIKELKLRKGDLQCND